MLSRFGNGPEYWRGVFSSKPLNCDEYADAVLRVGTFRDPLTFPLTFINRPYGLTITFPVPRFVTSGLRFLEAAPVSLVQEDIETDENGDVFARVRLERPPSNKRPRAEDRLVAVQRVELHTANESDKRLVLSTYCDYLNSDERNGGVFAIGYYFRTQAPSPETLRQMVDLFVNDTSVTDEQIVSLMKTFGLYVDDLDWKTFGGYYVFKLACKLSEFVEHGRTVRDLVVNNEAIMAMVQREFVTGRWERLKANLDAGPQNAHFEQALRERDLYDLVVGPHAATARDACFMFGSGLDKTCAAVYEAAKDILKSRLDARTTAVNVLPVLELTAEPVVDTARKTETHTNVSEKHTAVFVLQARSTLLAGNVRPNVQVVAGPRRFQYYLEGDYRAPKFKRFREDPRGFPGGTGPKSNFAIVPDAGTVEEFWVEGSPLPAPTRWKNNAVVLKERSGTTVKTFNKETQLAESFHGQPAAVKVDDAARTREELYMRNGVLHRETGPAKVVFNFAKMKQKNEYWLDGIFEGETKRALASRPYSFPVAVEVSKPPCMRFPVVQNGGTCWVSTVMNICLNTPAIVGNVIRHSQTMRLADKRTFDKIMGALPLQLIDAVKVINTFVYRAYCMKERVDFQALTGVIAQMEARLYGGDPVELIRKFFVETFKWTPGVHFVLQKGNAAAILGDDFVLVAGILDSNDEHVIAGLFCEDTKAPYSFDSAADGGTFEFTDWRDLPETVMTVTGVHIHKGLIQSRPTRCAKPTVKM